MIKCINLNKDFPNAKALVNVNLELEAGKIIGLLGPNGSGKTTLIKIINGLLTPTSGEILINGFKPGVETKKIISYLPDNNFLQNWMTVEQIVYYFVDFYDDFRADLAFQLLEKLQIDRKQRLKTLSKGNKEKVCLILVMSRNAKIYVLDEPIAQVDPATRDYIIKTILNNYSKDSLVLISTHLISDIEDILDEAIFLKNGCVILHKSVSSIKSEYNKSLNDLFREEFRW